MQFPAPEHAGEPIVIDGSNVARARPDGWDDLLAMEATCQELGWAPLIIVDASLRHKLATEHQAVLEEALEDGWIQVPKGHDADVRILDEAERLDAWVVSRDQFGDHERPPRRRLDPSLFQLVVA